MIITRTPYRLSIAGGGTDHPEWFRTRAGACLSIALGYYCYITIHDVEPFWDYNYEIVYREIEKVKTIQEIKHPAVRAVLDFYGIERLKIQHAGDLPARSGLGSSSSFVVGLLHAIWEKIGGRPFNPMELAKTATHMERNVIGECVGYQDQVAAAFGGANMIRFSPGDYDINFRLIPLPIDISRLEELRKCLLMAHTGQQRIASEIERNKINTLVNEEMDLSGLVDGAMRAYEIITENRELMELGEIMNDGWARKRSLSHSVTNEAIDEIYHKAISAGAVGGKLMGAGGGGVILFVAPPEKHRLIKETLSDLKWIPVKFDFHGSRVIYKD